MRRHKFIEVMGEKQTKRVHFSTEICKSADRFGLVSPLFISVLIHSHKIIPVYRTYKLQ